MIIRVHTLTPRRTLTFLAVAAATVAACTACALRPPGRPAPRPCPAASPLPASHAPGPAALLPVSLPSLQAAAALAARFTAVYGTRRPGQSPQGWLAALRPLATRQLAASLAATAATAALWNHHPATTAHATTGRARYLSAGSVTVTVTLDQATSGARPRTLTSAYALTLTRRPRGGWAVYDIEPAGAGST
jgi:hypothetical protein